MYMKYLAALATVASSLLFTPVSALAQSKPELCDKDKLIIGTGTASGTYAKMFASLADVCTMVCENRQTQGGYDNITNIVNEKFDGGIVQVDTLDFINRTEPNVKRRVRSLASLHGSSLHIFTPVAGVKVVTETKVKAWGGLSEKTEQVENYIQIKSLSDLKGRPVAAWASAVITATILDERLKLGLEIIEVANRAEGLKLLSENKVFAFMGMGGKPLDWVEGTDGSKAEIGKHLMMVNVGNDEIARLGAPYYGEQVTYRSIGALGVRTVTVRNELVVRNIQRGPLVGAVSALQACFKQNLEDIQSMRGKHPSWSDVSLDNPLAWEAYMAPAGTSSTLKK